MSVPNNMLDCERGIFNSSGTCVYQQIMIDLIPAWILGTESLPWVWATLGSLLVGLSGVLPLLVITIDETDDLKKGESANTLKTLLSFAVGGLLGDVFLHSLPEIWANDSLKNGQHGQISYSGLLILAGLLTFVAMEKLFAILESYGKQVVKSHAVEPNNLNNNSKGLKELKDEKTDKANNKKHIAGYLNLLANAIDNFTHGLSLGGAFLVSFRSGCFTTFAILVHEIPHEVGDFAILLKSGFSRWDAAKFQIVTAGGGLVGALAAIFFSGAANSMEARASWILPFTAGSFLHIALVTVLPDLLKEDNPKESLKQLLALLLGVFLMAFVTSVLPE